MVSAEEDRRVVQDPQLARHVHDAPDLEVDHGRVSPVDRDELLPLLVRERGRGPVGRVVLLDWGLADEGVAEVFRQLDVVWIDQVEPLVGQEVGQVGAKEVHVEAEGLARVLPVGRVLTQLLDRAVRQEALEGGLLGLVEARGDDVPVASAGQLAAPQVVRTHRREVVGLEPGDVLLVGHRIFGAPVCVVVRAELVGQVVAAVVLADDADVVAGVAQLLRVRPRALGDRDLVGDVPLGVGEHLVLARALAGQQGGASRRADSRGGEAMGEGEARFAHCVDDGGLRVGVAQAADRVGAVLVGHDDQDVAHVVGNVPSCISHCSVFSSLKSKGRALTSGRRPCPCLQARCRWSR